MKVPDGTPPAPVQLICVNGMVFPVEVKGVDELAVKILVAPLGVELARTGTGSAPEDTPATAPVPGSWLTVKLTTSMVLPLVPMRRLR